MIPTQLYPVSTSTPAVIPIGKAPSAAGLVLFNESPFTLLVMLQGIGSAWLSAWTADLYHVDASSFGGEATILAQSISSAVGAQSTTVYGNIYGSGEKVTGTYPMALARQMNVGNLQSGSGTVSQVAQSGETPPNNLVQASPAGYASSTLQFRDDGLTAVRGISNGAEVDFYTSVPGDATHPATVLWHGVADSATNATNASNVPATGVTAGALPGSVTLAATSITSGALASGVTLGAAQLTSGAIPAGVTLPATQLTTGQFPNGVNANGQKGDVLITTTALTQICTYTTPNDGNNHFVHVSAGLIVDAGDTNVGVVTLEVSYNDVYQGALTLPFNVYSQTNPISGINQAKGAGIRTDIRDLYCKPNTAVTLQGQNTAAGTKNDHFWGRIALVD